MNRNGPTSAIMRIYVGVLESQPVEIYMLPDNGLLRYGGFHINLAAGLEDDLINKLSPAWNKGLKETENETLVPTKKGLEQFG
jgi:hypothetical protein